MTAATVYIRVRPCVACCSLWEVGDLSFGFTVVRQLVLVTCAVVFCNLFLDLLVADRADRPSRNRQRLRCCAREVLGIKKNKRTD